MVNSWFASLRPASWRGVAFEVSGEDSEFGRNVVVHEFPQRNTPYVEDMGKKSRPYKMEAWLCAGPSNNFNVWTQRDALIEAVNKPGEGVLVHPFYGVLSGFIAVFTVKQASSENGGLINFTIEFVEAGETDFKSSTDVDTAGDVADSIESTFEALKSEFSTAFALPALGSLISQAKTLVAGFVAVVTTIRKYAGIASQIAHGNLSALFELAGTFGAGESGLGGIFGLYASVQGAVAVAESVIAIVRDLVEPEKLLSVTLVGANSKAAIGAGASTSAGSGTGGGFGSSSGGSAGGGGSSGGTTGGAGAAGAGGSGNTGSSSGTSASAAANQANISAIVVAPIPAIDTPSRNQQRINQAAFVNLIQVAALIRSVEMAADLAATSTRYAADSTLVTSTPALITREEMTVMRATVVNNINAQIIQLSAQGVFSATQAALYELKSAIVRHMTVNGEQLARTFTTTCETGTSWNNYMPVLPLAYRHYGQLTDDVIIDRNKIKNPLFINPRVPVVLLNDL